MAPRAALHVPAAAALHGPAAPAAAAAAESVARLRIDRAAAVFSFCWQMAIWINSAPVLTPWQHAQFTIGLIMVVLAAALTGTRLWARWRVLLIGLMRAAFALLPVRHSTHIGLASALRSTATPGCAGAALDAARVLVGAAVVLACCFAGGVGAGVPLPQVRNPPVPPLTGTRMLGPSILVVALQLPPLATLLQQAALLALCTDAPSSCSTPLLAHPLTRQRARWLLGALELVLSPANPASLLLGTARVREQTSNVAGAGQRRACRFGCVAYPRLAAPPIATCRHRCPPCSA